MATAPKLDRNRRIARAAINGATARELASQYKISHPAIRDAIKTAIKHDAPDFLGWGLNDLRANKEDILPLLTGEPVSELAQGNKEALVEAALDPWANLGKAAKLCGLNPETTKRFVDRLKKFEPVIRKAHPAGQSPSLRAINSSTTTAPVQSMLEGPTSMTDKAPIPVRRKEIAASIPTWCSDATDTVEGHASAVAMKLSISMVKVGPDASAWQFQKIFIEERSGWLTTVSNTEVHSEPVTSSKQIQDNVLHSLYLLICMIYQVLHILYTIHRYFVHTMFYHSHLLLLFYP